MKLKFIFKYIVYYVISKTLVQILLKIIIYTKNDYIFNWMNDYFYINSVEVDANYFTYNIKYLKVVSWELYNFFIKLIKYCE
jgi:hypothetical protein